MIHTTFRDGIRHELNTTYDDVFLSHRTRELEAIVALRESLEKRPARHIELGANRGAFLEGLAHTYPDQRVLGIEWRPKYVKFGNERLEKRGIDNASLVHADAKMAIPVAIPLASVEAFYVLFPDPWWKPRHASRRLLDPLFMRILARRLVPGGRIYLKSDVFDYLYRVRAAAEVSKAMRPLPADLWPDETTWTRSTRERKSMHTAIPFGRGYYERLADFPSEFPSAPERAEDFEMPDEIDPVSIIKGPSPADRDQWRKRR